MRRVSIGSLLLMFILVGLALGQQNIPIRLQPFVTGLNSPTLIRNAGDGSKRLFILQQRGLIKVLAPGSNTPTTFMDLTSKVNQSGDEQGLLGIAFHPQFATNHYFFIDYTNVTNGNTIIARYTAINNNTQGDPASERILLNITDPFSNHNGGMLEFGPDGFLYSGLGDGGSANDPGARAQNINEYWGKMLRINPDVSGNNSNPPYTSPADNPYAGATPGLDEIYTIGMRNPWRWSFDRGGTHQLWAGDVGQGAEEEFETLVKGGNYGWRVYEGNSCTGIDPSLCTPANYIFPLAQYEHTGGRCSITGGYVYRGGQKSLPDGAYLYADYCSGEIWAWNNSQVVPLLDTTRTITSFGEDEDGELYVVGRGGTNTGTVDKITKPKASADFDGDAKTDVSIYRPSNGSWYIQNSTTGALKVVNFGLSNDVPVAEDYDGDGISDVAVFRPSQGSWYILNSSNGTFSGYGWGGAGDIPAAADFDGDAKADVTVFRNGTWYTIKSTNGQQQITQFGLAADLPTVGDYDGDGKADIAVFRPSTGVWYSLDSATGNFRALNFGANGDFPAQGDFDGDGKTDITVFRASTGTWYSFRSATSTVVYNSFGNSDDVPAVGDFDGDGKDDIGVWRTNTGVWYSLLSTNGSISIKFFGSPGDKPVPTYDVPS